mgnify:CR=1 FL=1
MKRHIPRIALIAAIAENGVIGDHGRLPWHLPEDLKWFRSTTWGKPIIMGRRTWESIGRPLPGRRNLVLSRSLPATAGIEVYGSLDQALSACADVQEVCIIGGAELYAQSLALASRLYLTEIPRSYSGDTHFPPLDRERFVESARTSGQAEDGTRYDFVVLDARRETSCDWVAR